MRKYQVTFDWKIEMDGDHGIYQTGTSRIIVPAKNVVEAINSAIDFAQWGIGTEECDRNKIDLRRYMEERKCKCCYKTNLTQVLRVIILPEEK